MPYRAYEVVELVPLAARTTNGNTTASAVGSEYEAVCFHIIVSAKSGTTPVLNIYIDESLDGVNWVEMGSYVGINGVQNFRMDMWAQPYGKFLRVRWTITGTNPSFTFKVLAGFRS
jgi:hypothetical protein